MFGFNLSGHKYVQQIRLAETSARQYVIRDSYCKFATSRNNSADIYFYLNITYMYVTLEHFVSSVCCVLHITYSYWTMDLILGICQFNDYQRLIYINLGLCHYYVCQYLSLTTLLRLFHSIYSIDHSKLVHPLHFAVDTMNMADNGCTLFFKSKSFLINNHSFSF